MPTAPRIRSPPPTPRCSPANIRTEPSRAASGTICPRKPRKPLPKRSSTSRPRVDRHEEPADRLNAVRGLSEQTETTNMRKFVALAALLILALLALAQFGPSLLFGG